MPVADADGGNTEPGGEVTPPVDGGGGEGGGGSTEPGEGENPTEPGEGENDPVIPDGGDGTFENPYSIAEAKELTEGEGIWVKGYIVGSYLGGIDSFNIKTGSNACQMNLALADISTEDLGENTFPVDIDRAKNPAIENIQKALDLYVHAENLRKKLLIKGDIGAWRNSGYDLAGITNLQEAHFEGKIYKKK